MKKNVLFIIAESSFQQLLRIRPNVEYFTCGFVYVNKLRNRSVK